MNEWVSRVYRKIILPVRSFTFDQIYIDSWKHHSLFLHFPYFVSVVFVYVRARVFCIGTRLWTVYIKYLFVNCRHARITFYDKMHVHVVANWKMLCDRMIQFYFLKFFKFHFQSSKVISNFKMEQYHVCVCKKYKLYVCLQNICFNNNYEWINCVSKIVFWISVELQLKHFFSFAMWTSDMYYENTCIFSTFYRHARNTIHDQ